MLLRRTAGRIVAIPQPSHSWVSGQLAAAWGNAATARPTTFADWCLAAAIHDIGWATWDLAPTIDPETGWPRTFQQVSPLIHVDLWRDGVAKARLFGRYIALLVSHHADTIYTRRFDWASADASVAAVIRQFLDEQHALQRALASSLASDSVYGASAEPAAVEQARLALAAVDELSLHVCWGVAGRAEIVDIPTPAGDLMTIGLKQGQDAGTMAVSPWPFASEHVSVRVDGRLLTSPFESDDALRRGLAAAEAVAIETTLLPG